MVLPQYHSINDLLVKQKLLTTGYQEMDGVELQGHEENNKEMTAICSAPHDMNNENA